MYFTNGASKAFEKMMTAVPKFKKRGHGIFIANRFRHTPKSVDCALCTELKQKKCGLARCPYLVEKIEAGVVSYKTLVDDCFAANKQIAFVRRFPSVYKRMIPSLYANAEHIKRFALARGYKDMRVTNTAPFAFAALFLLTANFHLFSRCDTAITKHGIDFEKINLRGMSTSDYILFQAAKTIYTEKTSVTYDDLGDRTVVGDSEFILIVTACLITKYGVEVPSQQCCLQGMSYENIASKLCVPQHRISKWVWNSKHSNNEKAVKTKLPVINKAFDDKVNEMIAEIKTDDTAPINNEKQTSDVEKLQIHATNITTSYEKMLDGYIELREVFAFEECLGDQLDEYFTKIEGFIKGVEAAAKIILNANL